ELLRLSQKSIADEMREVVLAHDGAAKGVAELEAPAPLPIFWSVLAALSLSPQIANIAKQQCPPHPAFDRLLNICLRLTDKPSCLTIPPDTPK
ncbi:MAG: hypothetical protein WBD97_03415, partial [Pseudolabrys sp.]